MILLVPADASAKAADCIPVHVSLEPPYVWVNPECLPDPCHDQPWIHCPTSENALATSSGFCPIIDFSLPPPWIDYQCLPDPCHDQPWIHC
jgi:hypothetical protein